MKYYMYLCTMKKDKLYGAILGDLVGQPYEFPIMANFPPEDTINLHNPDSVFSDDTLMTLATAKAILDNQSFEEAYKEVGMRYQGDHYGKDFKEWLNSPMGTINKSWGNGCLMRIAPFMYLSNALLTTKELIAESCLTSHVNAESIVYSLELAELYYANVKEYDYFIKFKLFPFKKFEVKAKDTFRFCKSAFIYHSDKNTQDAIKNVVSCGGDTDTNASIVGELLNYHLQDLTQADIDYVESKLDPYLLDILKRFNERY
jgi:ADP-ribosyl-[dinitrogen reductase] hydrolase